MSEGFVKISKENIELKHKVQELETLVDSLRTELQKTHVHIHNINVSGDISAAPTITGGGHILRRPQNSQNTEDAAGDSATVILKQVRMALADAERREKDLVMSLRCSDWSSLPSDHKLPSEVVVAMHKIVKGWQTGVRLPDDLIHQSAADITCEHTCGHPNSSTSEIKINTANAAEGGSATRESAGGFPTTDELLQQLTEKDTELTNLYESLQEMEAAKEALAAQLEAEKAGKLEAEEHWRESHESAMGYYEENESLKKEMEALKATLADNTENGTSSNLTPVDSFNSPPTNVPPSKQFSSARKERENANDSVTTPNSSTIPAHMKDIVASKVEEEVSIIKEDYENQIETLKEKQKVSEDKLKQLSIEMGKQQLELKRLRSAATGNSGTTTPPPENEAADSSSEAKVWSVADNETDASTDETNITRKKYAAAVAAKNFALAVREEALNEVKELTRQIHKLSSENAKLLSEKTETTTSISNNQSTAAATHWSEAVLKSKDEQINSYQERCANAEAENKLAQKMLVTAQDEVRSERQRFELLKAEMERKIKSLEKKLLVGGTNSTEGSSTATDHLQKRRSSNSGGLVSPTRASTDSELSLMARLTGGNGGTSSTAAKASTSATGVDPFADHCVGVRDETPATNPNLSFKERIIMKRLMLQNKHKQPLGATKAATSANGASQGEYPATKATTTLSVKGGEGIAPPPLSSTFSSASSFGDGFGSHSVVPEIQMSEGETISCVSKASDKAEIITARLQRALAAKIQQYKQQQMPYRGGQESGEAARDSSKTQSNSQSSVPSASITAITSNATADFLSEMIADVLVEYEILLKNLQNEILSLQTIIAVKEGDAEEERKKYAKQYEDEFESLRVAKMLQAEEEETKRNAEMERLRHDQKQFQINQQEKLLQQFRSKE